MRLWGVELGFREMAMAYWLVRCFRDAGDGVVNGMGTIVDFAIEHLGSVWLATVVILLFVAL
jgi:hypothetical protein